MKIFKEMPTILPFYEDVSHQSARAENRRQNCPFKLLSPKNAILPFQIELPTGTPEPVKWEIVSADGRNIIEITNNLDKIKVYQFADRLVAVYFGDPLVFSYEAITRDLILEMGKYYTRFEFPDGSSLVSEIFYVPEKSFNADERPDDLLRIDFWNDSDLFPVVYRDEWKQTIFLDTYVHVAVPEIEEETEEDGFGNEIPVFQKMTLKYKFAAEIPDFIKIPFIGLQMSENVYIYTGGRSGKINRVIVNAPADEANGTNALEVTLEDDIIVKTNCAKNDLLVSSYYW